MEVHGKVICMDTHKSLSGAKVLIKSTSLGFDEYEELYTNLEGRFQIELSNMSSYIIQVVFKEKKSFAHAIPKLHHYINIVLEIW